MSDARFEVGTSITWTDQVFETLDKEGNPCIGTYCLTGTITKITPYTAVIHVDNYYGQSKDIRMDKGMLANRVGDWELEQAIEASAGKPERTVDTTPYTIYALADPCTGIIHYIGISKNVQERYKQHCTCSGANLQKNLWIIQLLQKHQKPTISTLEVVRGRQVALEREQVWIQHYHALGMPLTNLEGIPA